MSRPQEGNKRQIIVELSFGLEDSVNGLTAKAYYDVSPLTLTLPNLDYLYRTLSIVEKNPRQ